MVAFEVKDFGGEIPRRQPRLLPDNMATLARNVDLQSGPLNGLPQPEPVIDLSGTKPWEVRKAYRVPGPDALNPDFWLALPSEFSSVSLALSQRHAAPDLLDQPAGPAQCGRLVEHL